MRLGTEQGINYLKLEKNAVKSMRITAVICWLIMLIPAALLTIFVFEDELAAKIALALAALCAVIYAIAVPHLRYERYRYCIDQEAIRVREGFIWVKEQVVPIERLHKIAVSQGPIARMFKLSAIQVTTAGGDVVIKMLGEEQTAEISEALKKKINDIAINERENSR